MFLFECESNSNMIFVTIEVGGGGGGRAATWQSSQSLLFLLIASTFFVNFKTGVDLSIISQATNRAPP